MNGQLEFTIQSLLSERNVIVHGPMSPLLFAKEMAEAVGFKYNRIARLWFGDESIHQHREDGGLTGHDTLIIGMVYPNDLWLSLWVDAGVGGIAVAMVYQSDGEVQVSEVYRDTPFARNLSDDEIKQIFDWVFANPHLINLKND